MTRDRKGYPPKQVERMMLIVRSLKEKPCKKCHRRLSTHTTMCDGRCECGTSLRQRWQVQRTVEARIGR